MSDMNTSYSKEELDVLLMSAESDVVVDALMYLCFNINDPDWIQEKCIEVINGGINDDIKGLGITCIGHVARMYGRIDREKVIPVLIAKLKDASLAGRVQDTLDDIDTFVR